MKAGVRGSALVEILVAVALVAVAAVTSTQAMLVTNRAAARSRVHTAARAVVQRNIDTALGLALEPSTGNVPAMLATTTGPVVYDEDGGGDNVVTIIGQNNAGTDVLVSGTLMRDVRTVSNSYSADIRKITFTLNYTYQQKNFSVSMTTFRAIDD